MDVIAICIFCGNPSSDWWLYDARSGTCRCHACASAGVLETDAEKEFYKMLSQKEIFISVFEKVPPL